MVNAKALVKGKKSKLKVKKKRIKQLRAMEKMCSHTAFTLVHGNKI